MVLSRYITVNVMRPLSAKVMWFQLLPGSIYERVVGHSHDAVKAETMLGWSGAGCIESKVKIIFFDIYIHVTTITKYTLQ